MVKFCYYISFLAIGGAVACGSWGLAIGFVILSFLFRYLDAYERNLVKELPIPEKTYEILKALAEKEGMNINQYAEKIVRDDIKAEQFRKNRGIFDESD